MTTFSHILLTASAVAPILLVYAVRIAVTDPWIAAVLGVIVAGCVLLCAGLFSRAKKTLSQAPKALSSVDGLEKESLAFLVAYALPVVSASGPANLNDWLGSSLALATFVLVMGLLVWQQQLFYVNPLAAILGYHFHLARCPTGEKVLIVSRRKILPTSNLTVAEMSEYLWLDVY